MSDNGVQLLDAWTIGHLLRWADQKCFEDERDAFLRYALAAVLEDPLLIDYGWSYLKDRFREQKA